MEIVPVVILPEKDAQLIRLQGEASKVLAEAQSLTVHTADSCDYGVAFLAEISRVKKAAESRRTELVAPLNATVKRVNEFVKGLLGPVDQADSLLRGRILAYRQELARRAEEEKRRQEEIRRKAEEEARQRELEAQRKLEEAARLERAAKASADAALQREAEKRLREAMAAEQDAQNSRAEAEKPVVAQPPPAKTIQTGMGSATVKKVWSYELLSLKDVPLEYHDLSHEAVRRAIREGVHEIPGLRIFQREDLSVRA